MEHTPVPLALLSPMRREVDLLFFRLTWRRMRGMRRKLGFIAGALVWPLWATYLAARLVRSRGVEAIERGGPSRLKQWLDQIRTAAVFGRPPHIYYMYRLFQRRKAEHPRDYVTPQEFRGLVEADVDPSAFEVLDNKARFEIICGGKGLPTAATIAQIHERRALTLKGETCGSLPPHDLFIKPISGHGGEGAEVWVWDDDAFRSSDGRILPATDLLEHLVARSEKGSLLVQRRLTAEGLLSRLGVSALPTVRITTGRSRTGQIHMIAAVFKIPRADAIVDNFTAGAIACAVDAETGQLGVGYTRVSLDPVTTHPDTGVSLEAFSLPNWPEARELALEAHRTFSFLAFGGWDIAMTDSGPILIEGNAFPGVEMLQKLHGPLLNNPTFRALCLEKE